MVDDENFSYLLQSRAELYITNIVRKIFKDVYVV